MFISLYYFLLSFLLLHFISLADPEAVFGDPVFLMWEFKFPSSLLTLLPKQNSRRTRCLAFWLLSCLLTQRCQAISALFWANLQEIDFCLVSCPRWETNISVIGVNLLFHLHIFHLMPIEVLECFFMFEMFPECCNV